MLKKTLTNYFFLGLLSSVRSDGSYPATDFDYKTFVGNFQDKCSDLLDQSACISWDSLQDQTGDFQSSKATAGQEQDWSSSENSTVSGKRFPEENSDEEFLIDFPFADSRSKMNKRFNVFRRRNPNAQGYKRGPGFRSWGGKRNFQYVKLPSDKKTKFTSWGGKRDDFMDEARENDKRSKFVSWGGKRDFDYSNEKRTGFKSWGGKRIMPLEEIMKRDAEISNPYGMDKREPVWNQGLYLEEPFKKHFPKRPQFQSWGGKRALYPLHRLLAFFYAQPVSMLNGEKRKFSSWGGKRSLENQYNPHWEQMKNELKRHNFQSWGGKRSFDGEPQDSNQIEKRESVKSDSINENSDSGFGVWGGKEGGGR